MPLDNSVTIAGNLTDDPELRFTPAGKPVVNFTVAVNRRKKQGNEWKDELEGFFTCHAWGDMAENVAESLMKGSRVLVSGKLQQRSWEAQDGTKRTSVEIQVDEVGPSLRWAIATLGRVERERQAAPAGAWS